MIKKISKKTLAVLLSALLLFSALPLGFSMNIAAATTVSVLDGQVTITDTATNSMSESGGIVTVTAKGGLLSQTTNTITICNETQHTVTLTFDYSASNYSSFSESSASGTYSVLLTASATCTMSIKGKRAISSNTATLKLSNFSIVAAAATSDITFDYDSEYGSITVNGASIASGNKVEGISLDTGAALVATANTGATFHGWINADTGAILSTEASYTVKPASNMTVKAVFIGANSKPHFMVGGITQKSVSTGLLGLGKLNYYTIPSATYIFDDLNAAGATAASATTKGIVLLNSGTLSAGDYTIPAGVTLLVPFDTANTLYTTAAQSLGSYTKPTAYRALTLADGANLIINGALSLSAKHRYAAGAKPTEGGGTPTGPVSFIKMQGDSTITVNNGGALYAYGFITGSGSVTAKSGSTVYEYFQILDFRGGTQSTEMENGVFPMSQYYVQNIEVPMTLEYGAKEFSYTTIYMSSADFGSSVNFIAPDSAMFNLTSGKVTKRYDGSTDRLIVELEGTLTLSPISLSVGTSTLDSDEYELPINNNITVTAKKGSNITIGQDIAMLPGSEIIVEEGANCSLSSGVSVYIYDADQWGNFVFTNITNNTNVPFTPVNYAPGRTYDRTAADLKDALIRVDGTVDASAGYIYTTAGGANVYSSGTGTVKLTAGTQTVTHQLVQGTGYTEIPLTPAKLKNADGAYVQTGSDTYNYIDSKWNCTNHSCVAGEVIAPTCNAQGYTVYNCVACDHSYKDNLVDPTSHTYTSEIIPPTCSEEGKIIYTCSGCGDSYSGKGDDALGHSYESVVTDPTCTTDGYTKKTCSVCGDTITSDIVPALGHSYESVVTDPTCTAEGYTTYTCSACNHSYTDNKIAANGHSYESVVTDPTCTAEGYTTYTCSACNHSYTDNKIAANGHSYESVVTDPTCTEAGYTTHTCHCGDSYTDTPVDALGHDHKGSVTTAPTCEDEGVMTYTCSRCDDSYTESIAANGHSYSDEYTTDLEPTDLNEGSKSRHCANCDSTTDVTVIPANTDFIATVEDGKATIIGYKTAIDGKLYIPLTLDGATVSAIAENALTMSADSFIVFAGTVTDWEAIEGSTLIVSDIVFEGNIVGDINCDGALTADDLVAIESVLLSKDTPNSTVSYVADVNNDGKVSIMDLIRLKKYFANVDVTLGKAY